MAVQVNIRLDEATIVALDDLATDEGRTRAEVVRDAVLRRLAEATAGRIDAAYEAAYADHPETTDEVRRAESTAARLTADEAWEPWW